MTIKETEIINEMIDAWESLPGNKNYSAETIGYWLIKDMKPAIDNLRKMINRKISVE